MPVFTTRKLLGVMIVVMAVSLVSNGDSALRAADEPPVAKEKAKQRGRLPPHYGEVIDEAQREKVYQIQQAYEPQIEELQSKIKMITQKRNAEIDAVLTPEQHEKLKALQAEAKTKAEGRKKKMAADAEAAPPPKEAAAK